MTALPDFACDFGSAAGFPQSAAEGGFSRPLLGSVPAFDLTLPIAALGRDAERALRAEPLAPGLTVMDGNRLAGLLSRARLRDFLTRPYGADLYLCRTVERMIDRRPLRLGGDAPLDIAAHLALARRDEDLYEPLVLGRGDGSFGVIDVQALLRALADALSARNQQTTALLEEVRLGADRLRQTLTELEYTQATLVDSAKMASLGNLVAGVAHEVNTPVGILLGAASHFSAVTADFRARLAGGLKRSELEAFLDEAAEAMRLIQFNAGRAGELIAGFKQVSADQTSEERRQFLLAPYIDEVLAALRPSFRRRPISVSVDCPPELDCDTYPGALAQVLTNLMMNALLHAFDEDQTGQVRVGADQGDGLVTLVFADDGHGIPADHQPRIFEPFFTTRRGNGGTGLGLNIVYSRVVSVLKGSISVESAPGQGTRFIVTFPKIHPDAGADSPGSQR